MTNRLLVTGASGFLGRAFIQATPQCLNVVTAHSGRIAAGELALDLRNKDNVRGVIREIRPTHIVNFASLGVTRDASTLSDLIAVNTVGALNLVEASIEEGLTPHTVMFGTAYEYADSSDRLDETARLEPRSPYAISKTTLFHALKQYDRVVPLTFLRLFNVFGIGEPAERLIPFITKMARAREEISLTGGEQQRDFMFADDLIEVLQRVVALPPDPTAGMQTINVGTGEGMSLRTFISYLSRALERQGLAPKLNFGALPYRQQDPMRCVADNSRLLSLLGNLPQTNVALAIERTVKALHEH